MHCDVKVPKAEHAACVAKGLNEGIARLHVYDAKTRKRYLLNDQKRATPYAGRFVTVAGDMQEAVGRHPQDLDGVITIAAIATYVESAVVVMGGRVTRRTRTAVQARFHVAGRTLVDVEYKPRGEVWFFVRPDPERP